MTGRTLTRQQQVRNVLAELDGYVYGRYDHPDRDSQHMINRVFTVNHRLRQHQITRFDIVEHDADGCDHTVMSV